MLNPDPNQDQEPECIAFLVPQGQKGMNYYESKPSLEKHSQTTQTRLLTVNDGVAARISKLFLVNTVLCVTAGNQQRISPQK
jgi:hypothetical protein